METKFKTFITPNGEYGIIDIMNKDYIGLYTSQKPELLGYDITIEDVKKYFKNKYLKTRLTDYSNSIVEFDWDEHFPKDWKLVDIVVKIL
jgi:hypothetical protein